MDRLQSLEVFIAVAEEESFAKGARRMGLSSPSATRGINALEDRLGARLFTRTIRRVRLTDLGRSYLEDARHILAQLQAADEAAAGAMANPVGALRITCSNEFGRIYVTPILNEFEPETLPIHLVHIEGRRAPAKVRTFIDFAKERLRGVKVLR
ncbi:MAG: LysR family transcriptional regulator [Pseudomonadota bacterium]